MCEIKLIALPYVYKKKKKETLQIPQIAETCGALDFILVAEMS